MSDSYNINNLGLFIKNEKSISRTALFSVRYSFVHLPSPQTVPKCRLRQQLPVGYLTGANAAPRSSPAACALRGGNEAGLWQMLADDQGLDSFHICFKKLTSGKKEVRTQGEPTLFFSKEAA